MNNKQALFIITLLAIIFISFMAYLTFSLPKLIYWILEIALVIAIPLCIIGISVLIYEAYTYLGE
jgi:hypothetical protein